MTYPIPPRPATFSVAGTAPGCERVPNLYQRDKMGRRVDVLVVHTNWAGGVATIQSAINWAKSAPGQNTYPHYQHERGGRAAKLLDTDRRGIGNGGVTSWWRDTHGLPSASYRTLTYETSDRGTNVDPAPTGSWFTDEQLVSLTRDLAYEAVVHDIPPVLLKAPEGRGIAGHCFPFPYPVFTTAKGKQCPGLRKYEQLVDVVIPWTAAIVDAWTTKTKPEPTPTPEEFLMALTDQQQTELYDRIMGALPGPFSEAERDGEVTGRRRFVLDDADGNYLVSKLDAIEARLGKLEGR